MKYLLILLTLLFSGSANADSTDKSVEYVLNHVFDDTNNELRVADPGNDPEPPPEGGIESRIMPLGDSITKGTGESTLWSYRDHLQDLLGIGTYDFVGSYTDPDSNATYDVEHSGIGGNRTYAVEARVLAELQSYMPAGTNNSNSKVLLHIGTNDIDTDCNGCSDSVLFGMVQNVIDTINIIDTHDSLIDVYVATVIPKWSTSSPTDWVRFNTRLVEQVALLAKTNLYVVDMYDAFTDTGNCSPNQNACLKNDVGEVHPNNQGYQVMANYWYASIQANGG